MRVAFYTRVSTDRQQQTQTIEQQVSQLRAYTAAQPGWSVQEEHIFRDDGYSGAKLNRPALDALRDQAARAAFDRVLVTTPDRLARNYVHQMLLLEELERCGCPICFIDRPLSNDPHEQLVLQIRGAVAEYERTLIADRMRRGRLAKLRRGELLPWTRPPYGYRLDPERPRDPATVRVDPVRAAIVAELFAAYAAGGVTLYALAQRLTDRNVPSPWGRSYWTASSIRGILTNPAYIGQTASGRRQTVAPRRRYSALKPVGRIGHSSRPRPPEEWISVSVPAIIEEAVFSRVQERLSQNQQQAMRNTTHEYLLRGLVSCGVCQLSCTGRQRVQKERAYRYYVCRGKQNPVGSCHEERCTARFIPAEQLEQRVWDDLCQLLREPARVTEALRRAQSGAWLPEELRRRRETLSGIRARLGRQRERLLEAYLAEVLDLSTFEQKDAELRRRQEDFAAQEREIEAQSQRTEELGALAQSIQEISERLREGLEQATFTQRRQLVELLIDRVVVTNGEVEIRYVVPTSEASLKTRFCHLRADYFRAHPQPIPPRHPRELLF
jgi:site-specific DNA recombinase